MFPLQTVRGVMSPLLLLLLLLLRVDGQAQYPECAAATFRTQVLPRLLLKPATSPIVGYADVQTEIQSLLIDPYLYPGTTPAFWIPREASSSLGPLEPGRRFLCGP